MSDSDDLCVSNCWSERATRRTWYNSMFRFLFGDLSEAVLMLALREAGVEIVDFQRKVELEIAGHTIKGTLDVILRDEFGEEKVWDIKSASEWAFKYKYTGAGGYDAIKNDDPFGYAMQGFLYAEATGYPSVAGSWSTSRAAR